jgi:two-component system nitrogen regulation sensor histidine kinase NtrY
LFRRYPYWGWLLLSVFFWCVAGVNSCVHKNALRPANMARTVEKGLHKQEYAFQELLNNESLVKKIFTETLDEKDIENLEEQPYRIYAYTNDTALVFWNNNTVLADCSYSAMNGTSSLLYNDKGFFIKKCLTFPYLDVHKKLTVLFPVLITYPFENNYLKSHFTAADYIPVSTRILSRNVKGTYKVKSIDGKTECYLSFSPLDMPVWTPDSIMLGLIIIAFMLSIGWFHLITITLTRKRSFRAGLFITVIIVVGLRALTYIYGLPFGLENLQLFSPQLYASSNFLRSLGDLLLNALCFLWIIVFILRHVPLNALKIVKLNIIARTILSVLLASVLIIFAFGFINIISSLVLDSMISFDVTHFYSINRYTIIGLLVIGIITGSSCLFIYLINIPLTNIVGNKWIKHLLILLLGALLILLSDKAATGNWSFLLLLWLIIFIALLDIPNLTQINDLLAPHMIFWGVLVCAFCTGILQYFNHLKEQETRKRFAEAIVEQRDDVTEYSFKTLVQSIQRDKTIKFFIENPTPEKRRGINERFDALYLGGQLNKYQSRVLFYDAEGRSLYNNDTISYNALIKQLKKAEPTSDFSLFYKEYAQDGHYYLAYIPIQDSSKKLGYIFIDLAVKASAGESVYPELLQPAKIKNDPGRSQYGYAIYSNKRLITQTNDFSFPTYLRDSIVQPFTYQNWENYSELWYKADKSKTVIVAYYHRVWLETITLFSYLFGILMLLILLIVAYRSYLAYFTKPKLAKFLNLTLRRRIHFSMLGIVLVSFLIIGIVTTAFFNYQYKLSNRNKLQSAMQIADRSTMQYLKSENGLIDAQAFNRVINTTKFRYFIASLANAQKVDINVFNASGVLNVTSQENIYDKGLLARIIRPDAYYQLYKRGFSQVTQDESIGGLSYLSSYVPLRDENGITLGYINVPFFSSEKELNFQISNILVALINLYAFIFLISSLLTVFITRWLTRTLSVIINRFEKLSLIENELIEWPYDDEIGLLIREYNKMVKKVEDGAILLAQNERELAWREMAKQVAHEIKNPLTPMKLNIQYLQQSIKNKQGNVEELAGKVFDSLIEQIDNLSYIASEFSSFAKIPEARPEKLELNDLLNRATELYLNKENINVTIDIPSEKLYVLADKSQLQRVFSNLLENAVQSIPSGIQGVIEVALSKQGESAQISFTDNGTGISKEVVENIFQPYFTTKTSGTGLGLAMTKKIIEFWKGNIWFETKDQAGTTFYVQLPLA